jgi:hypothetical protein
VVSQQPARRQQRLHLHHQRRHHRHPAARRQWLGPDEPDRRHRQGGLRHTWGFVTGRTLGSISTLSFDWYRDGSSTNPAAQAPAFRLLVDADGNATTTGDRVYLIWEQVYNGPNGGDNVVPLTDQWVSSNLSNGEFWQRNFAAGLSVGENDDITLNDWASGANPSGAQLLSANSAVLGLEFGIGSGWAGAFTGFIDNVSFGFGDEAHDLQLRVRDGTDNQLRTRQPRAGRRRAAGRAGRTPAPLKRARLSADRPPDWPRSPRRSAHGPGSAGGRSPGAPRHRRAPRRASRD